IVCCLRPASMSPLFPAGHAPFGHCCWRSSYVERFIKPATVKTPRPPTPMIAPITARGFNGEELLGDSPCAGDAAEDAEADDAGVNGQETDPSFHQFGLLSRLVSDLRVARLGAERPCLALRAIERVMRRCEQAFFPIRHANHEKGGRACHDIVRLFVRSACLG